MDERESISKLTEDEVMEIDKLIILTPGPQLPDLFRKQVAVKVFPTFTKFFAILALSFSYFFDLDLTFSPSAS